MHAYANAGYDYSTLVIPGFNFASNRQKHAQTISINEGAVITDRASFEKYPWPDPDRVDTGILDSLMITMPEGMKLMAHSPDGLLENVIKLMGYERLCFALVDDPDLVKDLFDAVGSRLTDYYTNVAAHEAIGACIVNDDWGYKTQTMLSTRQMQHYVFPWQKRMVAAIHAAGKPAILHSCGHFERIIDDIIDDMAFDARHSYEDAILPVETAYERYHTRLAILGGIDVDFMCRAEPYEIYQRSQAMLARTAERGGYALGTGNSVPDYIPDENYFAMTSAALHMR
jgi:uroporphyrinogen decarboxylase